jgi:DNA topoisomerase-3
MEKSLVLAEKPSVGREIARVLGCKRGGDGYLEGEKYVVTWALGHLVTLADPEVYDKRYEKWNMADLPMLPEKMKLVPIKETGKQFRTVQALMKRGDIKELIIATDAGREGELVARWIMIKAGWKKPTKRLWISSQTDRAIKDGFANLRPAAEYDNLFRSAQARSEADWLVGLNVTRALTCKYNAQLSAGRVQTPTLAMIVSREDAIRKFVPKEFWGVRIKLDGFNATLRRDGQARIFDRELAEKLTAAVENGTAQITELTRTKKQTPPPAAYDLTELQRDANRKYAYSAKETLSLMQSLYERHKALTYPRTDSRYIPQDVVPTLPDRLRTLMQGEYAALAREIIANKPIRTKYIVNDAKVTDHFAIIPTEEQPEIFRMTGPEMNIYDLVVRRFMAVLLPPMEYDDVRMTLSVAGETFTARGKIIRELGWKRAYSDSWGDDDADEDEDDDEEQRLPELKKGDKLPIRRVTLTSGKTSPPARYTEATLLTAMEHPSSQVSDKAMAKVLEETSGLGTPATRADIIEKLFSSFYVERRGKELVPTSKGIQLVGLVPEELRSPVFTAKMEQRLANIAQGKEKDKDFVAETREYASRLVNEVRASDAKYVHDNQTRTPCPECGKNLLKVKGKRGEMLVCPDRECGYRRSLSQTTNARCPNCHKKMELRGDGDNQTFVCVCGYREKLSAFKERRAKSGAGKADVRRYMAQQNSREEPGNNAMAEQLAKWLDSQK